MDDGDGNLARGIVNGVVTFYPGRHYNREVDGANVTVKKFYTLGSTTVAVRTVQGSNDTLNWILGDHAERSGAPPEGAFPVGGLGSASVTATPRGELRASCEVLRNANGGHMMLGHAEEVNQAIQVFLSCAVPELAQ